jgi:hypothetical protein
MRTSETTDKVLPALLQAAGKFTAVIFDAQNTHFKSSYATLPAYLTAVQPALRNAGLLLTQATHINDGVTVVITRVTHAESGQWVGSEYRVQPVKADPQAEGSALTYARRYALAALLGLAADDDDGQSVGAAPAITEAQSVTLSDMLDATGADRVKFLAYFGIATVGDLPAKRFDEAMASLKRKERQRG